MSYALGRRFPFPAATHCFTDGHANVLRLGYTWRHLKDMQPNNPSSQSWPDLAIGLYDKLTGRGAEITYEMHNLEVQIPSSASPTAMHALWKINGTVKIRTKDESAHARA